MCLARMLSFYTLDASCLTATSLPVMHLQWVLFDDFAKPPPNFGPFGCGSFFLLPLFFSADMARTLKNLPVLWAGWNLIALSRSNTHLPPASSFQPTTIPPLTPNTRRHTMADTNRNIYFLSPDHLPGSRSSVTFGRREGAGPAEKPAKLSFSTGKGETPQSISFSTARCSEKGCVFPASSPGSAKCSYHMRQQEEPALFRSHQPTGLLLDRAIMGPAEKEYDVSRKRDRRRMAELWERFQSDGTQ